MLPCWLSAWILFVLPTAYKLPYMNILLCGSLALPADAAEHTVMKLDGTNLVQFAGTGTSGSKWLYPLSFDAVMLKHVVSGPQPTQGILLCSHVILPSGAGLIFQPGRLQLAIQPCWLRHHSPPYLGDVQRLPN
jgi:hypothetical protein